MREREEVEGYHVVSVGVGGAKVKLRTGKLTAPLHGETAFVKRASNAPCSQRDLTLQSMRNPLISEYF